MDFARRQLEKYGWTDGKGLGKNENGISEALKPKLKRSVTGIGHDPASDFTEHWWSALYDKAAKNVEVEEKDGRTKKIKTKDDQFKITCSTYQLNKKPGASDKEEYSDFFIRKTVLTGEGAQQNVGESESEEEDKKDVFKLTDEELFAACEGRTAHKGARHGLKATGKLARIAQQEQMLLNQPQYEGYSHAKKLKKSKKEVSECDQVVEDINLDNEEKCIQNKKKKKRKRCLSNEKVENNVVKSIEHVEKDTEMAGNDNDVSSITKKCKKSKRKQDDENDEESCIAKSKKKKRQMQEEINAMEVDAVTNESEETVSKVKKCKKKKKKDSVL